MRLGLILAAGFAVLPVNVQAQEKDKTFHGGPLDGIVFGPLVRVSDGRHVIGLKPSASNAAPVPSPLGGSVEALLRAYRAQDDSAFRSFLAPSAGAEFCQQGLIGPCEKTPPSISMHFAEHCDNNTPYFMGGGQVRIEWLCNGQLWYISFLDFAAGKISHVRTLVAEVPPMYEPAKTEANRPNG